jgi:hypothetical protein
LGLLRSGRFGHPPVPGPAVTAQRSAALPAASAAAPVTQRDGPTAAGTGTAPATAPTLDHASTQALASAGLAGAPVPTNPTIFVYNGHTALNLAKLRGGLNVAGMQRPMVDASPPQPGVAVDPTRQSLPVPQATSYRYATLVARSCPTGPVLPYGADLPPWS